jgi:hypothetical protein
VRQEWEHKAVHFPDRNGKNRDMAVLVASEGTDGWELVTAVPGTPAGASWLFFKRPKV